jgi:hypothetical protein
MATNFIKNGNELEKLLEQQIIHWLNNIASNIAEKYIEEFLESEFYSKYSPRSYKRTQQILQSIVKTNIEKNGNTYSIMVYLDPTITQGYYGDIGQKEAGYPPTNGNTLKVWENMNEGWHGFAGQTDGHFWDRLVEELDKEGKYDVFADFARYLTNKGIKTVKLN